MCRALERISWFQVSGALGLQGLVLVLGLLQGLGVVRRLELGFEC